MDKRYEQYCVVSPVFYDSPRGAAEQSFDICFREVPDDWSRTRHGDWVILVPADAKLPPQGWKIHVSACLGNCEETITRAWEYCIPRGITFKFVAGRLGVLIRNGKYAQRGSSGKIVTIYPRDEAECERILAELDEELGGAPGPYILSDLRYGEGPLYVRYGGFSERYCLHDGELVHAIENAAGDLVPDPREPVFRPPAWVPLPSFLAPHLAARNAARADSLPYRVEEVLHFSNGGGVYLASDERTGERVVLKEARPHAGLAADKSDAVARLRREHDMLRRLSGLGIAPEALGYFEAGGHHYLAEQYIEGIPLNACYAERYPLLVSEPDPADTAAYTGWALRICAAIAAAVAAMHEHGVVFNDLHMFNVIVRPDDSIALIDFEAASLVSEGRLVTVGNPGFVAPRDRTGLAADAYSLACLRLAMFLPLTSLLTLDRGKAADIAAVIAQTFPVPAEFLNAAVREITGDKRMTGASTTGRSAENLEKLCRAIRASATPARTDRLFPGDIEQFASPGGGLGLAHGAAGVLYALSEAAGLREPGYEQWLLDRVADPVRGSKLGLYDGLAGVAWTLTRLGHTDAAVTAAGLCLGNRWTTLGPDLYGGLAGFALAMLDIGDAAAEPAFTDAGMRAAELLAGHSPSCAGLLRGGAGHALTFIRLYERTADPGYLDLAQTAIAADLDRCVIDRKGSLQVDEGWRVLPYLNAGSAGIGMVIERFLPHRPVEEFAVAGDAIKVAARSTYYAQAGLFNGRAGMILYLAGSGDPSVAAHVRRLAWHAVSYADAIAFPGDQLLRLSMDLGTGTAGILLALAAARDPHGPGLPFLGPASDVPGLRDQGLVTGRTGEGR